MLDAFIIDQIHRREERERKDNRIPLYREAYEDNPQSQNPSSQKDESSRGVEDIDFQL